MSQACVQIELWSQLKEPDLSCLLVPSEVNKMISQMFFPALFLGNAISELSLVP